MGRPKGKGNSEKESYKPVPGDAPKPMVRCACSRLKEDGETCGHCGR